MFVDVRTAAAGFFELFEDMLPGGDAVFRALKLDPAFAGRDSYAGFLFESFQQREIAGEEALEKVRRFVFERFSSHYVWIGR